MSLPRKNTQTAPARSYLILSINNKIEIEKLGRKNTTHRIEFLSIV